MESTWWARPALVRATYDRNLVEALVHVPTSAASGVIVQVVVPARFGWLADAKTAAVVTVAAISARILAQQGDPE